MKSLYGIIALLLFSMTLSAQQTNLQYQFKAKDRFQLSQQSQQETYQTVDDIDQRTTQEMEATYIFTIENVIGGKAEINAQFKHLKLQASNADADMLIDTDGDETDDLNKLFKGLIGRSFNIVMYANGNVEKVDGLDKLTDSVMHEVKVKRKVRQALKDLLNNQLGNEAMKANLQLIMPQYPSHAVKTNDSWSDILHSNGLLKGQTNLYWKLTYSDNYAIKISSKGDYSSDKSTKMDLGAGMMGSMDLKGELQGNYLIDPSTGWPSLCIQHAEVKGNYVFDPTKQMKKGLTVPVRVVTNARFKVSHL